MRTLGRWLWILFALAVAIAIAIVVLPIALFSDPVLRQTGSALAADGIEALVALMIDPEIIARLAGGIFALVWVVVVAICVAPVTIIAVIGEAAGIRTILWHGLATALLAGAMPWILRAANSNNKPAPERDALAQHAEFRLALIFALTGLAGGVIYWLMAGRNVGAATRKG